MYPDYQYVAPEIYRKYQIFIDKKNMHIKYEIVPDSNHYEMVWQIGILMLDYLGIKPFKSMK